MLLDRAGMWNTSHSLVDDKLGEFRHWYPAAGPVNPWALAYPRAFGDLVDENSRANEVPPELQLALMREESAFNPRAESTANCLGLTMLKPTTARGLMSKEVTREELLDPETNLALGARHLASLLKRYRAVVPAIAAYNAGEGAVGRWLRAMGPPAGRRVPRGDPLRGDPWLHQAGAGLLLRLLLALRPRGPRSPTFAPARPRPAADGVSGSSLTPTRIPAAGRPIL